MAVLIVLSVRDRAINTYGVPIHVVAVGAGLRSFMDECQRPESPFCAHPDDYDLYRLGTFDDQTGLFNSENPQMLLTGKECAKPKE